MVRTICNTIALGPLDAFRGTKRISGLKEMNLTISRMNAEVVKKSATQTWVKCPYCNKTHIHGNAGKESIVGDSRASHCMKGEYKIIQVN